MSYLEIIKRLEESKVRYTLYYNWEGFETVEKASVYTGHPKDKILKTMILDLDDELIAYVARGDQRLDFDCLKNTFNKRVKLAKPKDIYNKLGLEIGGISILHPNIGRIKRYISRKCLEIKEAVVGGGDKHHLIKVAIDDILRISNPRVIDC